MRCLRGKRVLMGGMGPFLVTSIRYCHHTRMISTYRECCVEVCSEDDIRSLYFDKYSRMA